MSHSRLGLNTVESLRALQAAAETWPPGPDGRETACDLLWAAARTPRRVYVPVVEDSFARYGPKARVDALRLLLRIGDRRSAEAWLALASRHGAEAACRRPGRAARRPAAPGRGLPRGAGPGRAPRPGGRGLRRRQRAVRRG
ncbi:MAG: hypothetical protein QM765_47650 [Myxococcales bacterium]